ncbi:Dual 3',5'-cyclic-AMP and -GMP phosphodiesterase 11A [Myotis davidii]|uniref:Dual 3',5'-cyclic-AMP and-GMP phosphodiesterase 11A n=1 Tax=Myotis davidii TaxID=225400 RepID=L5M372_MYODS|nr:Dual 3',5'-cyclic-AMP and -GMP phosphodiesterase 11A [Myotis davidii]
MSSSPTSSPPQQRNNSSVQPALIQGTGAIFAVMQMYLPFCGIAISNAQVFAASRKEYERSRALLEVVNDLFEEQTDLEKIVKKIMHRAQTLLKCERCSVLLLEDIESPVVKFTKSFELLSPKCSAEAENRSLVCSKYLGNIHRYPPTHTPDIHLHEVIDKHFFLLLKEGDGPQEPIRV